MTSTRIGTGAGSSVVDAYIAKFPSIHGEAVEALLQRGELLSAAKADLEHGQWRQLCRALPFSERHAHRLRSIAAHPALADRTFLSALPDSVVVLCVLSRLALALVEAALRDGRTHPKMTLRDAKALAGGAGRDGATGAGPGQQRKARPWTLADALLKIHRIVTGAPADQRGPLAAHLRDLADAVDGGATKKKTSAPPRGGRSTRPDPAITREMITTAIRSATMKYHPDRPTGDLEKMKAANLAAEWLRAQLETLGGRGA